MGAAASHLFKLDRVQTAAERVGSFGVEPLAVRRSAVAVAFALKLMDGQAKGVLKYFIPIVEMRSTPDAVHGAVRSKQYGLLMQRYTDRVKGHRSVDVFKRGFWGVLPEI